MFIQFFSILIWIFSTARKVAVVHSYEEELSYSIERDSGFTQGLVISGFLEDINVNVTRMYMDGKAGNVGPAAIKKVVEEFEQKILSDDYEVLVLWDDIAFREFFLNSTIFERYPIVYAGINAKPQYYNDWKYFFDTEEYPAGNVTGVTEDVNLFDMVNIFSQIYPSYFLDRTILAIADSTPTGEMVTISLQYDVDRILDDEYLQTLGIKVDVVQVATDVEYAELLKKASINDSISFICPNVWAIEKEEDGKRISGDKIIDIHLENNKLKPDLATTMYECEYGMWGGFGTSQVLLGSDAAEMVSLVLKGVDPGYISLKTGALELYFNLDRAKALNFPIDPKLRKHAHAMFHTPIDEDTLWWISLIAGLGILLLLLCLLMIAIIFILPFTLIGWVKTRKYKKKLNNFLTEKHFLKYEDLKDLFDKLFPDLYVRYIALVGKKEIKEFNVTEIDKKHKRSGTSLSPNEVLILKFKEFKKLFKVRYLCNDWTKFRVAHRMLTFYVKSIEDGKQLTNLQKFSGVLWRDTGGKLKVGLVFEYSVGKTLRTWLREKVEKEEEIVFRRIIEITRNVALAMLNFESAEYVYRDLKDENLIISDTDEITLIDLETIQVVQQASSEHSVGTLGWQCPEIKAVGMEAVTSFISSQSDVFSFGLVCWKLYCREINDWDQDEMNIPILNPQVQDDREHELFCVLVNSCLKRKTDERPKFKKIVGTLDALLQGMREEIGRNVSNYEESDNPLDAGFVIVETGEETELENLPANKIAMYEYDREGNTLKTSFSELDEMEQTITIPDPFEIDEMKTTDDGVKGIDV